MNIQEFLLNNIQEALKINKLEPFLHLVYIQQTNKKKFGNYQVNGLINIAKQLNVPVKELAEKIVKFLYFHKSDHILKIEEPGFINIFLQPKWIETYINYMSSKARCGIPMTKKSKNIVIDYSSPNIAKEMHVGHLRSTVIGDSIARILSFLGHNVIRINHIGDWGTQLGMIIAYIENNTQIKSLFHKKISLPLLEDLYQKAKKKYDIDLNFAESSRKYVVKLQQGDQNQQKIWKRIANATIENNQKIYTRLNITLKRCNIIGESFYNKMLPEIVTDLKNKGLATISNGATVVFTNNNNTKNQTTTPFGIIIQKKDGAYLYSTTDIAAIKYRCNILQADRIIYYIDSRQKQHLKQAWEIAEKAGYIKKGVLIEHHVCGMLLNKYGKPFKTRTGNSLKLTKLLDEALKCAHDVILKKNPNLTSNNMRKLTQIIGIGSIKYSELSKNRTINYTFCWNKMLNFEGNTAPYILYAYTRISSLLRHANTKKTNTNKNTIQLNTQEEILLATCLLQFEETIITVANHGTPHLLCAYLYKISVLFSSFYERCPIIKLKHTSIKYSRLKLILLTSRILKTGLNLLGIKTVKYM